MQLLEATATNGTGRGGKRCLRETHGHALTVDALTRPTTLTTSCRSANDQTCGMTWATEPVAASRATVGRRHGKTQERFDVSRTLAGTSRFLMCRQTACVNCGVIVEGLGNRGPLPKRCVPCKSACELNRSRAKHKKMADKGFRKVCVYCKRNWLARHSAARFCSRNCQYLSSGGRVLLSCEHCSKTFKTTLKRKMEGQRFCSRTCMRQALGCPVRHCLECGQEFRRKPKGQDGKNDKALFCSKPCFFKARSAGRVSWDTTNQRKAAWHRNGPYASAPSARLLRLIANGHAAIEWASCALCRLASKELARPTCENCGCPCKDGASRFCSLSCLKKWRGLRLCELCGAKVQDATAYSKCRCKSCKAKEKTKANRRQKQKYGRNHRQRARRHGVAYTSIPVREIYERDGWKCQICNRRCKQAFLVSKRDGRPHPRSPTLDHIRSMANGGKHERSNLQLACFECNTKKGANSRGQLRLDLA
jgi:hypothetical protein